MEVKNAGVPQSLLSGYKGIAKEFVSNGWNACAPIGGGLLVGTGGAAVGVLGGAAIGVAGLCSMIYGGGRLAYACGRFGINTADHTYRSLTPSAIQDKLDSVANAVANSVPVKAAFSYCSSKCDSFQKGAWELAAAKVLPLSLQGKTDRAARFQKQEGYPERQPVLDHQVSWKYPFEKYAPPYYDAPSVLQEERAQGEAIVRSLNAALTQITGEPVEISFEDYMDPANRSFKESCLGQFAIENETPLNPRGRTGLAGRGDLPHWGPNYQANALVTRVNPDTEDMEVLLVKDSKGKWALPADVCKMGETLSDALTGLLEAEGIEAPFKQGMLVSQEYVEDARNTDNAWIESRVVYRHFGPEEGRSMPAVDNAAWVAVNERFDLEKVDENVAIALSKIEI